MAVGRRCAICRGSLVGMWGEAASPNRRYCSASCRQAAYRERSTTPAQRRRATAAKRAAMDTAAVDVERLLAVAAQGLAGLRYGLAQRSASGRLSYTVTELAATVELLAGAAVDYDRAAGVSWADLAYDTGLDETTLRRRQRRAAGEDATSA